MGNALARERRVITNRRRLSSHSCYALARTGLPTPGNVVDIVDDDGKLVPPLKEGHIAVKGN